MNTHERKKRGNRKHEINHIQMKKSIGAGEVMACERGHGGGSGGRLVGPDCGFVRWMVSCVGLCMRVSSWSSATKDETSRRCSRAIYKSVFEAVKSQSILMSESGSVYRST